MPSSGSGVLKMKEGGRLPFKYQVLGMVAAVLLGSGSTGAIALWAADKRIDEKYATDEDVSEVAAKVDENQDSIEETQQTVEETRDSVDSLTLIVLDAEISRMEAEIRALQAKESLTRQESQYMADLNRKLTDLRTQRQTLFEAVMRRQ